MKWFDQNKEYAIKKKKRNKIEYLIKEIGIN